MEKFKSLFIVMGLVSLTLLLAQCKRDHENVIKLTCYYVSDQGDTTGPIAGVWVEIDTSRISPHVTVDSIPGLDSTMIYFNHTNFCNPEVVKARGYTGADGSITFTFTHPLLMLLNATDTLRDIFGNDSLLFMGRTEVQVKDGEDVEKDIYLFPYIN